MSIRLYFSNGSIANTSLSCDSMGIHYSVTKKDGTKSVTRWDSRTDTYVLAGEIDMPPFRSHRVRTGSDGKWQPLKDFLYKGEGSLLSSARSFKANNGVNYRWKVRDMKLMLTHDLGHANQEALLTYHRNFMQNEGPYFEISDQSVLTGLDTIILTFLVMERRRRD